MSEETTDVRSETAVCEWPGCKQEALCQSGNFGNKLVCDEHFKLTNGSTIIDLIEQDEYWGDLEKAITQYNMETLLIDGYAISIALKNINKLKLGYWVYVNGEIKGKWYTYDNPTIEGEKFAYKSTRHLMSRKECKKLRRKYDSVDNKIHFYHPYFKSFRTLKRTFKRNNESIKWLNKEREYHGDQ